MKSERKSTIVLCIYFIAMLMVFVIFVTNLRSHDVDSDKVGTFETDDRVPSDTQIVYVPIYVESNTEADESQTIETYVRYIVKCYEEKIGIFQNGKLVGVIDVYTKTLPKTDQRLLEKGIVVSNENELNSLIEDYEG